MSRKDAGNAKSRKKNRKNLLVYLVGAVTLVAICLGLRYIGGAQPASAQAPGTRSTTRPKTRVSKPQSRSTDRQATAKKVAATVNGENVTRQQLADECLVRYGNDVLESIVNKHLIWQACKARGLNITDQDVEKEITRLAGKFGLSPGRWLALLQQERSISAEQYRREIVWPTLALRALAAKDIVVSPQELQQAFEVEYGPRVKVRAIMVTSQKNAEQLRQMAISQPDAFGELAKEHSEDPSASVNGLIPPIRKHMGDRGIEQAAFSLKEGEISPIVKIANQYVILKCEKHLPETYIAARFRKDAENRIRDRVQDQKLRSATASLFQRLQQDAQMVNIWNDPKLRQQNPGVAATINGQRISIAQLAEECIIRHGGEVLDGEINRRILTQALKKKNQEVTMQDLDREVARAADAYGYMKKDGTADVQAWLKEVTKEDGATVELYVRDAVWPTVALKKLVDSRVQVTDEDINKGFVSNYGPRVEVLAIVMNNHRQAQKVWEMARGNPTDSFFGELAHQYSVDPVSRENFGKVPPIRRYGGRPDLEKEAFSLQPGQLSGIIASEESFIILRCTGHTSPVVRELDDEVRGELVKDIREKKLRFAMTVEFDRLRDAAQVENFLTGKFQTPSVAGRTSARPSSPPRRG